MRDRVGLYDGVEDFIITVFMIKLSISRLDGTIVVISVPAV